MINIIIITMFFISAIIFLVRGIFKLHENIIRYKAISFDEFQTMAAAMDKTTGSREWRNNFIIFKKVYKAAKIAKNN